jgi:hypothetical protein
LMPFGSAPAKKSSGTPCHNFNLFHEEQSKMTPIMKTIVKDIIVLSAQAVAYRLASPPNDEQHVVFAAVPTAGPPRAKAITDENEPRAQRIGF